jgi:hypothetical protein
MTPGSGSSVTVGDDTEECAARARGEEEDFFVPVVRFGVEDKEVAFAMDILS